MLPQYLWLAAITVSQLCYSTHSFVTPSIVNNEVAAIAQSRNSNRQRSSILQMACCSKSAKKESKKVPITLLSGFLGSGKTTTLQHLLENVEGTKIGVIVNDVASINIDAKLVTGKQEGVVELQNGCACCSLSDELLSSVDQLLSNKRSFDALVVEMSGVADPLSIQNNWKNAKADGKKVVDKAEIAQVVTLVDSTTFGTDWMTWDTAGDRDRWVSKASDDCGQAKRVPELLAEQIEAADVILLNKKDLAGPEQLQVASSLAQSLNDKAKIIAVEYGKVQPSDILKELGTASETLSAKEDAKVKKETSCCDHEEAHEDSSCCDESHSHSHSHSHTHAHSHDHGSTHIDKLGVTSFVYKADRPFNTKKLLGLLDQWPVPIKNDLDLSLLKEVEEGDFESQSMYPKESPFLGVLRSKGFCWFAPTRWTGQNEDIWRHNACMYWSHAGKQFGISKIGQWWGTISREEMKERLVGDPQEYNRILKEDFVTEEFADRRQEIVFIGIGMDEQEIRRSLDDCLVKDKGMKRYREYLSYMQEDGLL